MGILNTKNRHAVRRRSKRSAMKKELRRRRFEGKKLIHPHHRHLHKKLQINRIVGNAVTKSRLIGTGLRGTSRVTAPRGVVIVAAGMALARVGDKMHGRAAMLHRMAESDKVCPHHQQSHEQRDSIQ